MSGFYIIFLHTYIHHYSLPYRQDELYEICLSTCDDGQDGHDLFPNEPNMAGDR